MSVIHRMYSKGWSTDELAYLEKHRKKAAAQSKQPAIIAQKLMYWAYLVVMLAAIFAINTTFTPFLLRVHEVTANLTVAFVAGCVAAIFGHVLHELEELNHGHHAVMMLVGVAGAVGSSWIIARQSLHFGVLFAVVFAILYGYYWKKGYERNKFT